jgi:DNA-binding NarL/FixJ family response regulator
MKRLDLAKSLPKKPITVLLAEDNVSFRKSVKALIEADGEFEVVGEAKNGREAVDLALGLLPEVVIMDIAMPLLNGLQATQQIMARSSATRVLVLSAHPDPEYIERALKCGASGYLIKQSASEDLIQAIRRVQEGKTYFSASISKSLRDQCLKAFDKAELLRKRATHSSLSGEDLAHPGAGEENPGHIARN